MKTVKPKVEGGVPERMKDEDADRLVKSGGYVYCKKTEWKKEVRDKAKLEAAAAAKAKQAEKQPEKRGQGKDRREINKHKDRPRR